MAHFDADAALRGYPLARRETVTFTIGDEKFVALPEPSLGDALDLHDAPEITPTTNGEAVFALAHFIERMLPDEDRPRFRTALRAIPATQGGIVVELGDWLVEQITGNPTKPPGSSASGRSTTGPTSKKRTAGKSRSS
jgi:hypothetical protein